MIRNILITPKSFGTYKHKAYPLIKDKGYEIIENTLGRTMTEQDIVGYASKYVVGIIVGVDPLPAFVLEQCKDLKAVSKYGVGMDNIDLIKAKALGIKVKNAVGTNSISVAEHAIGLMFSISRNIPKVTSDVKQGKWDRVMGCELTEKKLGLIGGGQIGREVAQRAYGLEMEVGIFDPYLGDDEFFKRYAIKRYSSIEELLKEVDIVSLHVPVTKETKEMMNEDTFNLMKPYAFLINTSRGELVDEEALYKVLKEKRIAGAAQDVFSCEPPGADEKLLKLDNFILTSHIAAYTHEAVEKMVMVSTRNLLDMLEG